MPHIFQPHNMNSTINYKLKYLKYKLKYTNLKQQIAGTKEIINTNIILKKLEQKIDTEKNKLIKIEYAIKEIGDPLTTWDKNDRLIFTKYTKNVVRINNSPDKINVTDDKNRIALIEQNVEKKKNNTIKEKRIVELQNLQANKDAVKNAIIQLVADKDAVEKVAAEKVAAEKVADEKK